MPTRAVLHGAPRKDAYDSAPRVRLPSFRGGSLSLDSRMSSRARCGAKCRSADAGPPYLDRRGPGDWRTIRSQMQCWSHRKVDPLALTIGPEFLQIVDQRRAEMAVGLFARMLRHVAPEKVEWFFADSKLASVGNDAHHT